MQKLHISQTLTTPEILFSPGENIFLIKGTSSPEDVRALYYPVIDWVKTFVEDLLTGSDKSFNKDNPLQFSVDLTYFNSSSAKFLFDIFTELKKLIVRGIPVKIVWIYEEEDSDMYDAGVDISVLAGMEFSFSVKS